MTPWKQTGHYAPHCSYWYPLLPSFSARIVFAIRNLFGIACCAALALIPETSRSIQGQILLGLGFIVAIRSTIGATIQASSRLFFAGILAASYCLLVINFLPRDIYFAVGATNVFVLLMVYTDLPPIVRRFSILPTCIILLQWFNKSQINTFYVLHTWASLSLGGAFAIIASFIPLPALPTAYRELTMRMRFICRQIRREVTALVSLMSEYHNVHLIDNFDVKLDEKTLENNRIDPNRIESAKNSYDEDDYHHYSASFENLKDDHLLKSDIQDLNSFVHEELKQMERALTEIPFEPYFISLKLLNLMRKILRGIPFVKKFIKKPSTLQTRLEVWTTSFVSLQRVVTGILSLDHHSHAFAGQRKLMNAVCILIDTTFNFLEAALSYTTYSTIYLSADQIASCRLKVEEALEKFFETYAQVLENPNHLSMSHTDSIHLNTFLLLVLRLVHVIITGAETSQTPGTRLDSSCEQTSHVSLAMKSFHWKKILSHCINYIGLRPSFGKFVRAIKTSLAVLISAIIALTFRERLQADNWVYWAPMTTALVSDSSEGGTIRLSFQRLVAVLLGSTYAYIVVVVSHSRLVVGIAISLFVAFMGYIKTDKQKEYFAVVCGQSASIIAFLSNQEGSEGPNKAVLARTSLTFLGIFIHVVISNLFLPISARRLTKKRVITMMNNVSSALKLACDDFCSFVGPSMLTTTTIKVDVPLIDQQTAVSDNTNYHYTNTLTDTEKIIDNFPALLEEALSEPNFWKRPFIEVKDRYDGISKTLRRIIRNIRFVHRCTTILKAETKLHFALESRWQLRRASIITTVNNTETKRSHAWVIEELRKNRQLQNDLDVPLTIFMTNSPHSRLLFQKQILKPNGSSTSLRLGNNKPYELVLQHISTLESNIQKVILLTKQLIEKQTTVDVGSFELQLLCREELLYEQKQENSEMNSCHCQALINSVRQDESDLMSTSHSRLSLCCQRTNQQTPSHSLPSLRSAVDLMLTSLIEFLYANNHFIRTELVSIQSIGDILAFHTLSYALKDMVEATTDLATNSRRIKNIDMRTIVRTENDKDILY